MTTETVHRVPTRVTARGIHRGMARKAASWQARLPSPTITRILHRLWPSRRCSTSPEQEPRHTAGPPDTRERGEVRRRAVGRTWGKARAEVGISPHTSPRVNGLRVVCPITTSDLLKLVCPICLAGDCRTPGACHPSQDASAALDVRQTLSDWRGHNGIIERR